MVARIGLLPRVIARVRLIVTGGVGAVLLIVVVPSGIATTTLKLRIVIHICLKSRIPSAMLVIVLLILSLV